MVAGTGAAVATVASGTRICGADATVSDGAFGTEAIASAVATPTPGEEVMLSPAGAAFVRPDGVFTGDGLPVGSVIVPSGEGNWLIGAVCNVGAATPSGASAEGAPAMLGLVVGVWSVADD